jgi:hypothetical protein
VLASGVIGERRETEYLDRITPSKPLAAVSSPSCRQSPGPRAAAPLQRPRFSYVFNLLPLKLVLCTACAGTLLFFFKPGEAFRPNEHINQREVLSCITGVNRDGDGGLGREVFYGDAGFAGGGRFMCLAGIVMTHPI